ncbi:MAG: hypothetical protein ACJAW7_002030 [Candidatus Azotimanducaceae bacterium]
MDVLAYFIPGFHNDKFNNEWWGDGFTEWDNIKQSAPLYDGHFQPNKPLDGFYDLASLDVLANNFKMAKEFGIDSFIFYDYWYDGKRPLGSVMDLILKNQQLDFGFSLCWGNHSWTKSWKNRSGSLDVLIEQTYGDAESINRQVNFYVNAFHDPRYYKVDGRPLFQIYRPNDIPNLDLFISSLVNKCVSSGLKKPYLVANYSGSKNTSDLLKNFDSLILTNPTLALFSDENLFSEKKTSQLQNIKDVRNYPTFLKKLLYRIQDFLPDNHEVFDYSFVNAKLIKQSLSGYNLLGGRLLFSCFTGFDNTPRYKNRAKIVENTDSAVFSDTLQSLYNINKSAPYIAINAWNEWGEGMVLEPSTLHGYSFLESIMKFKKTNNLL